MLDRRGFLRVAGAATTALVAGCSTSRPSESGPTGEPTSDPAVEPTTRTQAPLPSTEASTNSTASTISAPVATTSLSPVSTVPPATVPPTTVPPTTVPPTTELATTTLPETVPPPSVPASLDELAAMIHGRVVRPGDPTYDATRFAQNTSFDNIRPAAVVVVQDAHDAALAISFASAQGLPFTVRSGGHSYGGWSSCPGIVIDVRSIAGVLFDAPSGTAVVGAGAALIDVYSALAQSGVAIAAGSCPTVGIAGLTLGGGHGLTGRAFGLTCDQMRAVEIVTADGAVHQCDASTDADLYWACRGGGGGSFGVVTSFTFDVHAVPQDATTYTVKYSWSGAAAALAAWVDWVPTLPDSTTSLARLEGTPQLVIAGLHLGPPTEISALLASLPGNPTSKNVTRRTYIDALMLEAGCSHTSVAACHSTGISVGGTLARPTPFAASSHYYGEPLAPAAIATAMSMIEDHRSTVGNRSATIQFDAYGGAINRVPADATAFVHRTAFCSAQYASFYGSGNGDADRAWVKATRLALEPFSNGEAYQNYADPGRDDWATAYYGSNLARLQRIKRAVDPGNVFSFPQSIPG